MQTIAQKRGQNLEKYAGEWVALLNGRVVESAKELSMLMGKMKRKRFKRQPSVFLVPRKDEGPYVLVLLCN